MEKPILFNTEMVKAILDRRKTMTRRIIKPQPKELIMYCYASSSNRRIGKWIDKTAEDLFTPPCHGDDILWVRETWCNINKPGIAPEYYYLADCLQPWVEDYDPSEWKWKPSIHMPREAARLFLRVNKVRVERLQDITEEDAISEGTKLLSHDGKTIYTKDYRNAFQVLWNSLYSKQGFGWDANPWVWVIEFERVDGGDR